MTRPSTPAETLLHFLEMARKKLHYVYPGNLPGLDADTRCPDCRSLVIERTGYRIRMLGMDREGHCTHCGHAIAGSFKYS
jgi:pyruvate formate lyase activating enzyme